MVEHVITFLVNASVLLDGPGLFAKNLARKVLMVMPVVINANVKMAAAAIQSLANVVALQDGRYVTKSF